MTVPLMQQVQSRKQPDENTITAISWAWWKLLRATFYRVVEAPIFPSLSPVQTEITESRKFKKE